jgi:type II secretory pathway component GspD/PulD (secretin)
MRQSVARALTGMVVAASLLGPMARSQQPAEPRPAAASALPAPDAKKARKAFDLAQRAELAGDWAGAFESYVEATRYAPQNGGYLVRREAARFQIVQRHLDRAERAALAGRVEEARAELKAALALDPAYSVAQERLAQLESARPRTLEAAAGAEAGLPRLEPQPGTRSFDYRGETRGAYEEIARAFGLAAAFDPDLRARQIRFRVADVDFVTAMRVLAQQTGTFWWATDAKAFFVADDTAQKRRDLGPSVTRTLALSGLATPEQMTELTRMVREISGLTRTQLDTRSRTLTLRGSPLAVGLAARLVAELEAAAGELMLEVDILEMDREESLRLGITPPASARIFTISPLDIDEAQQSPEALLRVLQRVFGSTGTAGTGLIPPLIAVGGGRTILLATLPGAAADFLQAYSTLRRGRRMLLRAQDGQAATFFIGERFPIALATLQPNLVSPIVVDPGTAFPRRTLAAGDAPTAIAAGEFNGDGRMDLAAANANADNVSVFLGNGDGTFGTRADFSAGDAPSAVAVADFNLDGRADLAVANEAGDSVSILPGNGDGTFGSANNFTVGDAPRALIALDFNADGRPDLATADFNANSVTVLLGNGDGTFQAPRTIVNVGQGPRALAAGNLNAGTVPDLVVVNQNSDTAVVLLGNGDGTFTAFAQGNTGDEPSAVLLADFDGDSLPDLAIANEESDTVSLLLGNGDGTFGAGTEFVVGDGPVALATADFNLDSQPDLAVANAAADTVTILLGVAGGGFGLRADFETGDGPASLVAVDFTGDGRRDLAIADREADTISVILNNLPLLPGTNPFLGLQTPYPGFQYEDLGLKVRATPRLHPRNEVTLQLKIEIRSRTGQTINGIPVISNRTIEQTLRLRENERTVLAGILQREERLGITGWPGLAQVPGVSRAVSLHERAPRETELLVVLTPRRIRLADRAGSSIYVGREPGGAAGGPPQ